MDCNQLRELLEAYALGALEADERARVEQHLASCTDCQRLAAEYADVAHSLPEALAAAAPLQLPPALKNRVLDAVAADTPLAQPTLLDGRERPRHPGPTTRSWFGRWRWRTLAMVATSVLLVVVVVWNIRLNVALAQERALRVEFAQLVDRQELVLEVVDAAETIRHVLRSPDSASRAYGKLFTRPDMPYLVAMAARLPPAPDGQAYHLWLIRQGQPQLAGMLNVNTEGFGLLIFEAEADGPTYEAAQVTLQPEGSTTPSGEPILIWPTSSVE